MSTEHAARSNLFHCSRWPRWRVVAVERMHRGAGRSVPGPTIASGDGLLSSPWVRALALIAAAVTTYVLVESIALLGMPPPDTAPRLAQAAAAVLPR